MPNVAEMLNEQAFASALTDEELAAWLDIRCGKLTASRMADAMAYYKREPTKPMQCRTDLLRGLLAERLTGLNIRNYVTKEMAWGLQTEPEAKAVYVAHTGQRIRKSMFYEHPVIENFGCTPDAELGTDTLVEYKCPTTRVFLEWVLAGVVPEEHKPQMLAQIACTRRGRVIFVAFDPRIRDDNRRLFIREYVPTIAEVEHVEDEARKFLSELDECFNQFVEAA